MLTRNLRVETGKGHLNLNVEKYEKMESYLVFKVGSLAQHTLKAVWNEENPDWNGQVFLIKLDLNESLTIEWVYFSAEKYEILGIAQWQAADSQAEKPQSEQRISFFNDGKIIGDVGFKFDWDSVNPKESPAAFPNSLLQNDKPSGLLSDNEAIQYLNSGRKSSKNLETEWLLYNEKEILCKLEDVRRQYNKISFQIMEEEKMFIELSQTKVKNYQNSNSPNALIFI